MHSKTLLSTAILASLLLTGAALTTVAADQPNQNQEPPVVDPGPPEGRPPMPSCFFDGKDFSHFRGERSPEPKWKLENGVMETTPFGGILSKQEFGDCQVHVEWAEPSEVKGEGQGRGNSGVYLMGRYEIQVLDCYNNKTYPNGQCGAFYGHNAPLVNVCRKPGEWQAYDIIFHAPKKLADGTVAPGSFTGTPERRPHPGPHPGGSRPHHRRAPARVGRKRAALSPGPRQSRAVSQCVDSPADEERMK